MSLKIATWNVNSLRVRLGHILKWLEDNQPDILALQETKLTDDLFPYDDLQKAGYHCVYSGQKTYNGVAILSKEPLTDVIKDIPGFNCEDRRILAGTFKNIRIWNVYVPNGEHVTSQKYQFKLSWLEQLNQFLKTELATHKKLMIMGDFNIAPDSRDVHDPLQWEGQVLFSEAERAMLQNMIDLGLIDCFRLQEQPEKSFTWWDYRLNAFKRNMGLRIDHILASPALAEQCARCFIDKTPRSWERPSDHVPVIVELHH
ncbi:MAG TPA: exodeoxyribonuclease III [Gammaproteobacteria bacterium]|nr:exodeoxyribonuclease III [Gammaproteobacteria bacterium]